MAALAAGTFAFPKGSLLSGNFALRDSTGVETDYVLGGYSYLLGISGDHTKLVFFRVAAQVLRVYSLALGTYTELAVGAGIGCWAMVPDGSSVLLQVNGETFVQRVYLDGSGAVDTPIPSANLRAMVVAPNNVTVYTGYSAAAYLRVFNISTGAEVDSPFSPSGYVGAGSGETLVLSPDGTRLAVSETGGSRARVYDTADGSVLWSSPVGAGWDYWLSFSPDGALLSVASDAYATSQHTQVIETSGWTLVRYFPMSTNYAYARGRFVGDGDALALLNYQDVGDDVVDANDGSTLYTLSGYAQELAPLPAYWAPLPPAPVFWTNLVRAEES